MINLNELQKEVYQNKVEKGFNIENIYLEFNLLYGEVAEAFEAYLRKKEDLGEELADIVIYLLGLAEILNINLEKEILEKVKKNKKRKYRKVGGIAIRIKDV